VDARHKAGHDEENCVRLQMGRKSSLINSVDRIFTTSMEAAFTNTSGAKTKTSAIACLCRARNAD
jgi:hypothetical protein